METFEFDKSKMRGKLTELLSILELGRNMELDLSEAIDKLSRIIKQLDDEVIRIVLLGSFSDGKTSAIAGLLGRLEDSMKIDQDESSDELTIYRPQGLKQGFEIVDTPGLFGTKEKEVNGKTLKYSEITEKYISEAHMVIYVCDAVTPLKESHGEIMRLVMRKFKKLEASIFVINKMDEAGVDMLDKVDYDRMRQTKIRNLTKRLQETIDLTPQEAEKLHIACIAADPKGKGLHYWFDNMDNYMKRSHIEALQECLRSVIEKMDTDELSGNASIAVLRDILIRVAKQIAAVDEPLTNALTKSKEQINEMEGDCRILKNELNQSKQIMTTRLNDLKSSILSAVNHSTPDTIGDVVEECLGVEGKEITCYVLNRNINQILSECCETNNYSLNSRKVEFERKFNMQETLLKDALKHGGSFLKNMNISGEMVKAGRDLFAKSFKFKPWGAINMGKNLTKWAGRLSIVLAVGIELWEWFCAHKREKKFAEMKEELKSNINDVFAKLFKSFDTDEEYYKNFAPSYTNMVNMISERKKEISHIEKKMTDLKDFKERLKNWFGNDIEDVEYEEI